MEAWYLMLWPWLCNGLPLLLSTSSSGYQVRNGTIQSLLDDSMQSTVGLSESRPITTGEEVVFIIHVPTAEGAALILQFKFFLTMVASLACELPPSDISSNLLRETFHISFKRLVNIASDH